MTWFSHLSAGSIALLSSLSAVIVTQSVNILLAWWKARHDDEEEEDSLNQQVIIAREANETKREEMYFKEIENLRQLLLVERREYRVDMDRMEKEHREEIERLESVNKSQQEQINRLRERVWDLEHPNVKKTNE
jgi:hypothetical protein